jgi:hypothetical protein
MRNIEFICQTCQKVFTDRKACKSRHPKFCGQECYGLSLRKDRKCPICGEHVKWCNLIYCSKKCESVFKTGKSFSEDHKKQLSLAKQGYRPEHLYTEEVRQKISNSLMGKPQPWMRGENHPNYIDGGAGHFERQKAMGRVEYKEWRRAIFLKDDFTCTICKQKGGKLNADHIKSWSIYPELRYDIDNGRTLCVTCHRKTDTWGAKTRDKKLKMEKADTL